MTLATRCPTCRTTFRVTQDRLDLRDGLVRCGNCKEVFNGNEHLLGPAATPTENQPAPTPTTTPRTTGAGLEAEFARVAAETADAPWSTPGKNTSAGTPPSQTAASTPAKQPAPNTLTQELPHPIPLTSSAPPQATDKGTVAPGETKKKTETNTGGADDIPAFIHQAERRERWHRTNRIVIPLGVALLAIILLLQTIHVWRNTIADWLPATRPLLSSACAALHCSISLPANIAQLSLESAEMQLTPSSQKTYMLTMLLRNHSRHAQAWPHLELTLDDVNEKAIIRRIFTPREYLRPPQQVDDGLPGDSEQQIKLIFELAQPLASAYRVYLFFP